MERGQHLENNLKKLESITDIEWKKALWKCKKHVQIRLRRRTVFGAHSEERLGMDPAEYYVGFACDAILDGHWEWKAGRTLGQQLVRIADNRIGKEVDKYRTEADIQHSMAGEDIDQIFYSDDLQKEKETIIQEAVYATQIAIIEKAVAGDEDLTMFWECIKEGMNRRGIADFMEKTPKQIDKLREKLMNKIKNSPHFQLG